MGFKERLKEARLKKKMTQEQVAREIGVAKSTFTGYEKGNSEPNMLLISKIMNILDIDANFLWQDEMNFPVTASYKEMEHIKKYRKLDDRGKEIIETVLDKELLRTEELQAKQDHINQLKQRIVTELAHRIVLPLYAGFASAGSGEYLFDDIPTDTIEVADTPTARRADFVIGVDGDSMEPDFYDGDKIFVKKTADLNIGDMGIFLKGSNCYLKELGEDRLISHNKAYKDIYADDEIRTIGKVIGKVEDGGVTHKIY